MRVYLCGPMRGYPGWNAAAFDRYAAEWEREGHTVLSPVARDRLQGLDPTIATREELAAKAGDWVWMRQVIVEDVEMVCQVDILAVLPGWEASTGATVEVALALFLGLPVYSAVSRERIYPTPAPWSRLLHVPPGARKLTAEEAAVVEYAAVPLPEVRVLKPGN
jgi:Domain of unknown function (DUF4406)